MLFETSLNSGTLAVVNFLWTVFKTNRCTVQCPVLYSMYLNFTMSVVRELILTDKERNKKYSCISKLNLK